MDDLERIYWPEPHPAGRAWREQRDRLLYWLGRLSPASEAYRSAYDALVWIEKRLFALEAGEYRRWRQRNYA